MLRDCGRQQIAPWGVHVPVCRGRGKRAPQRRAVRGRRGGTLLERAGHQRASLVDPHSTSTKRFASPPPPAPPSSPHLQVRIVLHPPLPSAAGHHHHHHHHHSAHPHFPHHHSSSGSGALPNSSTEEGTGGGSGDRQEAVPDEEQGEEFFVGTGGVGGLTQALLGRAVPGAGCCIAQPCGTEWSDKNWVQIRDLPYIGCRVQSCNCAKIQSRTEMRTKSRAALFQGQAVAVHERAMQNSVMRYG